MQQILLHLDRHQALVIVYLMGVNGAVWAICCAMYFLIYARVLGLHQTRVTVFPMEVDFDTPLKGVK